jgi:hypothetical protein
MDANGRKWARLSNDFAERIIHEGATRKIRALLSAWAKPAMPETLLTSSTDEHVELLSRLHHLQARIAIKDVSQRGCVIRPQ